MIQKTLRAFPLLAGFALLAAQTAFADGPFSFFPLTPCRVIDTRNAVGPNGGPSLAANTIRNFPIINVNGCGVPNTAKAVAFNFTTVGPTEGGDLRIWPYNSPVPLASVINFSGLDFALANGAIIGVANISGVDISVQTDMAPGSIGTVHLVADVTGYFQ